MPPNMPPKPPMSSSSSPLHAREASAQGFIRLLRGAGTLGRRLGRVAGGGGQLETTRCASSERSSAIGACAGVAAPWRRLTQRRTWCARAEEEVVSRRMPDMRRSPAESLISLAQVEQFLRRRETSWRATRVSYIFVRFRVLPPHCHWTPLNYGGVADVN